MHTTFSESAQLLPFPRRRTFSRVAKRNYGVGLFKGGSRNPENMSRIVTNAFRCGEGKLANLSQWGDFHADGWELLCTYYFELNCAHFGIARQLLIARS